MEKEYFPLCTCKHQAQDHECNLEGHKCTECECKEYSPRIPLSNTLEQAHNAVCKTPTINFKDNNNAPK